MTNTTELIKHNTNELLKDLKPLILETERNNHLISFNTLIQFNLISNQTFNILSEFSDISLLNDINKKSVSLNNLASFIDNRSFIQLIDVNRDEHHRQIGSTSNIIKSIIKADNEFFKIGVTNAKNNMIELLGSEFENLLMIECYKNNHEYRAKDFEFFYKLDTDNMTQDQINYFINQIYSYNVIFKGENNSNLMFSFLSSDSTTNFLNIRMHPDLNGLLGDEYMQIDYPIEETYELLFAL